MSINGRFQLWLSDVLQRRQRGGARTAAHVTRSLRSALNCAAERAPESFNAVTGSMENVVGSSRQGCSWMKVIRWGRSGGGVVAKAIQSARQASPSRRGKERYARRDRNNTKGAALVIPLLPPRARERGVEKLPRTPSDRLFISVQGQGCAAPVLPFDGTVKLSRRAGSAALDLAELERATRSNTLPEPCRSRCRITLMVRMLSK